MKVNESYETQLQVIAALMNEEVSEVKKLIEELKQQGDIVMKSDDKGGTIAAVSPSKMKEVDEWIRQDETK